MKIEVKEENKQEVKEEKKEESQSEDPAKPVKEEPPGQSAGTGTCSLVCAAFLYKYFTLLHSFPKNPKIVCNNFLLDTAS